MDDSWKTDGECAKAVAAAIAAGDEARKFTILRLFQPEHVIEYDAEGWTQYCKVCPVQAPCLRWGILEEDFGVWGGVSDRDRKPFRDQIADGALTIDEVVAIIAAKQAAGEPVVKRRRKKRRRKPVGEQSGFERLTGL